MIKNKIKNYLELTKFRLVGLVLLSVAAGFFLAAEGEFDFSGLWMTLLGVALASAGSMTLNQWMERTEDGQMQRTCYRPLPIKSISPKEAFIAGILLSASGLILLFFTRPFLCFILTAATLAIYLLIYTPLKKITTLNTLVGAVPGALPPLVGWVSAADEIAFGGILLFFILFLWQLPHFLAISWVCREDYKKAGFAMLATGENSTNLVTRQIILYTFALLPVSLLPTFIGLTGPFYFVGALILGVFFAFKSIKNIYHLDEKAKSFFFLSIAYLSILLILMVLDKT